MYFGAAVDGPSVAGPPKPAPVDWKEERVAIRALGSDPGVELGRPCVNQEGRATGLAGTRRTEVGSETVRASAAVAIVVGDSGAVPLGHGRRQGGDAGAPDRSQANREVRLR